MSDFDDRARKAADAVRRRISELPAHDEEGIRRAQRSPARVAIPAVVAAAVLVGAVAIAIPRVGGGITDGGTGAASGGGEVAYALTGPLKPFDTCDGVLQYFKDRAPEYLIARVSGDTAAGSAAGAPVRSTGVPDQAAAAAPGAESGGSSPEHSQTNVQEAGVDEPDIVKTDGNRIVAIAQDRVHLISSADGKLALRTTLPGTAARNVFLSGDRLLVFSGQGADPSGEPGSPWAGSQAVLTMYDISSLSKPRLVATLTVDGDVLDARLVGTQVRVATVASPDIDAPAPVYTPDGRVSAKSKEELRAAVARTTVDNWIPSYVLKDGAGAQVDRGHLVECADLARPEKFSGLDTVAVSSFDMNSALQSRTAVGVIAGGEQIYASNSSTYVSTTEWSRDSSPATTSVHKFVTASSGATTYRGSGDVPGTLLNQYAMSEDGGVLRVATTVSERRGWANVREVTEGRVTTLQEQDGVLRQLGQVGGLGRQDNESIRAVRFIGNRGYVVTFRQTDPLYVLDLRDAAAPRILGELKIPGYSGYLHPIGDDLLLGVGQSGLAPDTNPTPASDAQAGVQFSLFDISDPASPRRIDTQGYGAGTAAAEFDPKAFLYWQPRDLVIAPTTLYGDDEGRGAFSGVVLLRATGKGLEELGKISVSVDETANRSFVIGDAVYLLSDHALQSASLDTFRQIDKLNL